MHLPLRVSEGKTGRSASAVTGLATAVLGPRLSHGCGASKTRSRGTFSSRPAQTPRAVFQPHLLAMYHQLLVVGAAKGHSNWLEQVVHRRRALGSCHLFAAPAAIVGVSGEEVSAAAGCGLRWRLLAAPTAKFAVGGEDVAAAAFTACRSECVCRPSGRETAAPRRGACCAGLAAAAATAADVAIVSLLQRCEPLAVGLPAARGLCLRFEELQELCDAVALVGTNVHEGHVTFVEQGRNALVQPRM